jgi:hypothetical protein
MLFGEQVELFVDLPQFDLDVFDGRIDPGRRVFERREPAGQIGQVCGAVFRHGEFLPSIGVLFKRGSAG